MATLHLESVWYVQHGNGDITGVFRTMVEAEMKSETLVGERHVLSGWMATVDGESGYLVSDQHLMTVR